MQQDEDEDDENTMSAVRFPCMPSLVSLQYMRNRLHLSHLGRKLMKWTAMATNRELRKIALALNAIYKSFYKDMSSAFLLLARGRYFCPNMNKMVLENIANNSSVTVIAATKAHSGLKVIQYDLHESGIEPYEHLGIEKGGQQIHEAKVAWLQLLKRLVLMLEMKISFIQIEDAYKSATKRMNVMNKIIIPRTKVTIHYILLEMEEMAREELFRIKIIKKKKLHAQEKMKACPICKKCMDVNKVKSELDVSRDSDKKMVKLFVESQLELPQKESIRLFVNPEPTNEVKEVSVVPVSSREDGRLDQLKKLLTEIIVQGKNVVHTGLNNLDINEFLITCEEAKTKIEHFFCTDEKTTSEADPSLNDRLNNLKHLLHEVIQSTREFGNEVTANLEDIVQTQNKEVGEKLDINTKNDSLDERTYCALTPSVETFMKLHESCQENIDSNNNSCCIHFDKHKIDNLQNRVEKLQEISATVEFEGMPTADMEKLASCCENFKDKLEAYKKKVRTPLTTSAKASVGKLGGKADYANSSGKTPKKISPTSEYVSNLIDCCKNIKKLCCNDDENEENSEVSKEICRRVDCIINVLKQLDEGVSNDNDNSKDICQKCLSTRNEVNSGVNNKCNHCKEDDETKESNESYCEICSKSSNQTCKHKPSPEEKSSTNQLDSSLGLFEKKVKKIVRVTRTLTDDGTIREETETITITKSKRDPNTTALTDDDDIDNVSFDDIADETEERNYTVGFMRKVKSERPVNAMAMAGPTLRQCNSLYENVYEVSNTAKTSINK